MERTRTKAELEAQLERTQKLASDPENPNAQWYATQAQAIQKELDEWSN